MKVKDVMMRTPYACHLDTNLGAATELMWKGNCGFLPVLDSTGKIRAVLTDRDICIALGTRNVLPGAVTVAQVIHDKLFTCSPEDNLHDALRIMRDGHVRRLPVINHDSKVIGIISMHDILLHAEPVRFGKEPELSSDEVVSTYRLILQRDLPVAPKMATV
ncbi:MAG TPA: CBS domain-containing protein [Candidatus Acidoferrum sp.]|jgi:CBS domain-containing protein